MCGIEKKSWIFSKVFSLGQSLKNECFPKSETSYFLADQDAEMTFIKNDKDEVTEIRTIFNGREMKAEKIK